MPRGYPDWQRITQWLNSPIVDQTFTGIPAASFTSLTTLQVGSFAYLFVLINPQGGNDINLTLTWKGSTSAVNPSMTVAVRATGSLPIAVPVLGTVLEIKAQASLINSSVKLVIWPSNVPPVYPFLQTQSNGYPHLAQGAALAIGIGGTNTDNLNNYTGPAQLSIRRSAVLGFRVELQSLNAGGLISYISYVGRTATGVYTDRIWIPPMINNLLITDEAATASNYTYSLVAAPNF